MEQKNSVVNINLSECIGVQYMFDTVKSNPSVVYNKIIDEKQDARVSRITLVEINMQITDLHKNWNIFFI